MSAGMLHMALVGMVLLAQASADEDPVVSQHRIDALEAEVMGLKAQVVSIKAAFPANVLAQKLSATVHEKCIGKSAGSVLQGECASAPQALLTTATLFGESGESESTGSFDWTQCKSEALLPSPPLR